MPFLSAFLNLPIIRPLVRHALACPKLSPVEIFFASAPASTDEALVETLVPLPVVNETLDQPEGTMTFLQSVWDFFYIAAVYCLATFLFVYMLELALQWLYAYSKTQDKPSVPTATTCSSSSSAKLPSSLQSTITVVNEDFSTVVKRSGAGADSLMDCMLE